MFCIQQYAKTKTTCSNNDTAQMHQNVSNGYDEANQNHRNVHIDKTMDDRVEYFNHRYCYIQYPNHRMVIKY